MTTPTPEKNSRLIHKSIYMLIGIALFAMGVIAYWQFYPYQPVIAQVQPFLIVDEDKILQAGDPLIYRTSICKDFEGEVRLDRVLVNDILIRFSPQVISSSSHECEEYDNYSLTLPDNTPNGKYHMEITATVKVNPIRDVSVKFITEEFRVENPVLLIPPDVAEELLDE